VHVVVRLSMVVLFKTTRRLVRKGRLPRMQCRPFTTLNNLARIGLPAQEPAGPRRTLHCRPWRRCRSRRAWPRSATAGTRRWSSAATAAAGPASSRSAGTPRAARARARSLSSWCMDAAASLRPAQPRRMLFAARRKARASLGHVRARVCTAAGAALACRQRLLAAARRRRQGRQRTAATAPSLWPQACTPLQCAWPPRDDGAGLTGTLAPVQRWPQRRPALAARANTGIAWTCTLRCAPPRSDTRRRQRPVRRPASGGAPPHGMRGRRRRACCSARPRRPCTPGAASSGTGRWSTCAAAPRGMRRAAEPLARCMSGQHRHQGACAGRINAQAASIVWRHCGTPPGRHEGSEANRQLTACDAAL